MFSIHPSGPIGYKYVETCTIDLTDIKNDEQNDKEVFVNVDGSYYQFAEIIDGNIEVRNKHEVGRLYGFSMKLSVIAKSLENIKPQIAPPVGGLETGKIIKFSVIINEADQEKNRINVLLKKIYQEQVSSVTPLEEFITEIAKAVINKRQPEYSEFLLDSGLRDVSHEAGWDCDFCERLERQIAKLDPSQTNIEIKQVPSVDYPNFKIPSGCRLFKAQIEGSETFFDLGQHAETPVVVYTHQPTLVLKN